MNDSEIGYSSNKTSYKFKAITPPVQHAEGPHWDANKEVLYFVDTFKSTAYCFNEASSQNKLTCYKIPGRDTIGVIIPIKAHPNQFVITSDRNVYLTRWDTENDATAEAPTVLHHVDQTKPKNQFNDGKADAKGRLWTGTLTREQDLSVTSHGGCLYSIDFKAEKISKHIDDVSISNGMAWSKDNKRFFYTDSETRKIVVYDFDVEAGSLGEHKELFDLELHPELKGIPDGLTIDSNDNLWIALFGGHGIIHVNGNSGELIRYLELPTTYCTAACFGGTNQETLFVTTSNLKLKGEDLKMEPEAGAVFALTNLGVRGRAPYECLI